MAIIRNCFVTAVLALCVLFTNAQTVSYPAYSSQLLKSTAADAAMLFAKAIPGNQFTTAVYTAIPQSGVIFIYDSTITDNQACKVQSDGINFIKFTAAQDNGLCFGFYQYLQNLGFRFYQPGSIWEIIPTISTPYKKTDSIFTTGFKYNSWSVSGGHNRWIMDMNGDYGWDTYYGSNGHNWALYQRRNGMTGAYRFNGHRDDIMTGAYFTALQNNPCYVACYDSSRVATRQSVPDVNNSAAKNLWANTIEQKFTQYKNTIFNNSTFYVNQYRNFNYTYQNISIEVPDAAHWGNSMNNQGCINIPYAKESDQQFTLANFTAQKINAVYPNSRLQVYAYSTHADVPSAALMINDNIDVQLIPEVYQVVTSTNGLRNRWYKRSKNISEYNYLNLSGWSGETPAFNLNEFKATVQIAKDNKSQGLFWEASPAKFASLPYLLAANKSLVNNISVDNTLLEFCDNMFAGAGKTIYDLLLFWTDSKNMAGATSNKYKLPYYLQLIARADVQTANAPGVVKERLQELKAYLHYMALYFDWASDQRTDNAKMVEAAGLCKYLAKINKMQLVNSYYLIYTIAAKYASTSNFYQQYNVANGSAYQNGNLPLITAAEIENDFQTDLARYGNSIDNYTFESTAVIQPKLETGDLIPQQKITVQLKYTNGIDYYNRSEFYINAPKAGNFTIDYKPSFDRPDKGYINFLVESADRTLDIIEDFTIDRNAAAGILKITIPSAGTYKLTISSKYKSSVDLDINTNKNVFYKSGAFFGKATEIYKENIGMPGYFYIPASVNKVYFSISNSNPAGTGFASAEKINNEFAIQDNNEKILKARFVTPNDSALFYIDVPAESKGKFCRITKKSNYGLIFSNISNYLWYAQPKPLPCSNADFKISVINKKGNCITQLTAVNNSGEFAWEVTDMGSTYTFSNQRVVELPDYSSPNAVVTLTNGINCSVIKKLRDDNQFLKDKQACASGAPLPDIMLNPVIYPNPSTGNYNCFKNGAAVTADEIIISNAQGARMANFIQAAQFNISLFPAGLYWYKILVKGVEFKGKLVKL